MELDSVKTKYSVKKNHILQIIKHKRILASVFTCNSNVNPGDRVEQTPSKFSSNLRF